MAEHSTAGAVWRGLEAGTWEVVDCQFTDVAGALKSVLLPAAQLSETLRYGHWFDGSALEGSARAMETDLLLRPDLATWSDLPWPGAQGQRSARVLCDVLTPEGQPFAADPRGVLRRVIQEAAAGGLRYVVGAAVEFYLFAPAAGAGQGAGRPVDQRTSLDPAGGAGEGVCSEVVRALEVLGVFATGARHTRGPGQHAIDLPLLPALAAADAVVDCKFAVRAVARRRGLAVTFMPRPLSGAPASALGLRQALRRPGGEDAAGDVAGEWGLSPTGRAFVAGQQAHAVALYAVLAQTVNSYRSPAEGEARNALAGGATATGPRIRRRGRVGGGGPMELELEYADPACNPYLALGAALAAGLDGLRRNLPLSPPPAAPASLAEAIAGLAADDVVRDALGPAVVERLLLAKGQEWAAYRREVSPWELARYFESA